MEDDSIDMEDDLKMTVSIWEITVSIWKMTVSIWDILSLCWAATPDVDKPLAAHPPRLGRIGQRHAPHVRLTSATRHFVKPPHRAWHAHHQGLTLVQFPAQRKRFLADWGRVWGLFRGRLGDFRGY